MKKITNKQVQTALLRGAVLASGCVTTAVTALFFDDIYGVIATLMVGAGLICLINNQITINQNSKER
jgi:hypothetical protein